MKKIPLHSLVLVFFPKGQSQFEKFAQYEIVDQKEVSYGMVGEENRRDLHELVQKEMISRISQKIGLGERVVVNGDLLSRADRLALINPAQRAGIPIYYLLNDLPDDLSEDDIKAITRGDGLANVIDSRDEEFIVIEKVQPCSVASEIRTRGFNGVIAVADVHGMVDSLKGAIEWAQTRNLFMIFLGDIVDYGPNPLECVDLVYDAVTRGRGVLCMGNHERKIHRWLQQSNQGEIKVRLSEGNKVTTQAIERLRFDDRYRFESKYEALMHLSFHHVVIGKTLFAHGAAEPEMFNIKTSKLTGSFENISLFGEVDRGTKTKENGFPNRIYNWVDRIPKDHMVVVGHDILSTTFPHQKDGELGGRAVFMDTGSGKGGRLTTADLQFTESGLKLQSFAYH